MLTQELEGLVSDGILMGGNADIYTYNNDLRFTIRITHHIDLNIEDCLINAYYKNKCIYNILVDKNQTIYPCDSIADAIKLAKDKCDQI